MIKILSLLLVFVALLYPVSSFADAPATIGVVQNPDMGECDESAPCMTFVPTAPTCEANKMQVCERLGGVMTEACDCAWVNGFCLLDLNGNGRPESTEKEKCDEYIRKVVGVRAHGGHGTINRQLKDHEERLDNGAAADQAFRAKDATHDDRLDKLDDAINRSNPENPGVILDLSLTKERVRKVEMLLVDGDKNGKNTVRRNGVEKTVLFLIEENVKRKEETDELKANQGNFYLDIGAELALNFHPPITATAPNGEEWTVRDSYGGGVNFLVQGGHVNQTRRASVFGAIGITRDGGDNDEGEATSHTGINFILGVKHLWRVTDGGVHIGPYLAYRRHLTRYDQVESGVISDGVAAGPAVRMDFGTVALEFRGELGYEWYGTRVAFGTNEQAVSSGGLTAGGALALFYRFGSNSEPKKEAKQ